MFLPVLAKAPDSAGFANHWWKEIASTDKTTALKVRR